MTPPVNDNVCLSSWNQHDHTTEHQKKRDPNAASATVEVLKSNLRETTYPLQISVRDAERMEVLQPLRDAEQLPQMMKPKLVFCCSSSVNRTIPHQSQSRRAGI